MAILSQTQQFTIILREYVMDYMSVSQNQTWTKSKFHINVF